MVLGENLVEGGRQNKVQEESRVGGVQNYKLQEENSEVNTKLVQKNQNNRYRSTFNYIEYNISVNRRHAFEKKSNRIHYIVTVRGNIHDAIKRFT